MASKRKSPVSGQKGKKAAKVARPAEAEEETKEVHAAAPSGASAFTMESWLSQIGTTWQTALSKMLGGAHFRRLFAFV
jgi:hypothetical protein